jgi:hypothetical protein
MRATNCWLFCVSLLIALLLIYGSASGTIGMPLPWAVIIGLGVNAIFLLLEHRQKMEELMGKDVQ